MSGTEHCIDSAKVSRKAASQPNTQQFHAVMKLERCIILKLFLNFSNFKRQNFIKLFLIKIPCIYDVATA